MKGALSVAAKEGVRGVTHRKVAAAASVSLGVTSYHYANIDDLLLDAFRYWVTQRSATWSESLDAADTEDEMIEAAMRIVTAVQEDRQDRILLYELYAQTVRDERYHELATSWSTATRTAVARFYTDETAQRLEAVWEGLSVQLVIGGSISSIHDGIELIRLVLRQPGARRSPE